MKVESAEETTKKRKNRKKEQKNLSEPIIYERLFSFGAGEITVFKLRELNQNVSSVFFTHFCFLRQLKIEKKEETKI